MHLRIVGLIAAFAFLSACGGGLSQPPVREQRLPSGKVVKVVSCLLAWGAEHDERLPDQDAFALEYVSKTPREPADGLAHEAVEAFELIRPISEQWGFKSASVTVLRNPERMGTYDVFAFTRAADGAWSHTTFAITRK